MNKRSKSPKGYQVTFAFVAILLVTSNNQLWARVSRHAFSPRADPPAEWETYTNQTWGYSIDYPLGWSADITWENDNTIPDHAFRQRVNLLAPDQLTGATVEVWRNENGLGLPEWIRQYQQHWFEQDLENIQSPNATVGEQEAFVMQRCSDPIQAIFVYLAVDDQIFRIWYGGENFEYWEPMLSSFFLLGSQERGFSQLTAPHLITDETCESRAVLGECDYQDADLNDCCEPYNTPVVPYWDCSRDIETGEEYGNCVWWAAHERPDVGAAAAYHPGEGSACWWDYWAHEAGFLVDDCTRTDDIFVYDPTCPGHVAYVTDRQETTVSVTEMNWCSTCLRSNSWGAQNRKFIHTRDLEVVLYWDLPNDIANLFGVPGSCNGQRAVWRGDAGWENVPSWFDNQASAILIPSGWSVRLYQNSDRGGLSTCLNASDSNSSLDKL